MNYATLPACSSFNYSGIYTGLLAADSLLRKTDSPYKLAKEAGLVPDQNQEHLASFSGSRSLLQEIKRHQNHDAASTGSDAEAERASTCWQKNELRKPADPTDFGYQFRQAKWRITTEKMDAPHRGMKGRCSGG